MTELLRTQHAPRASAMSTLFSLQVPTQRQRAVSHGGLGGLVQTKPGVFDSDEYLFAWNAWWTKQRRSPDTDGKEGTAFASSPRDVRGPIPRSRYAKPLPDATVNQKMAESERSLFSPIHQSPVQCVHLPLQVTSKKQPLSFFSSPIELPGSLLLPSQGFPQENPPITPPRQIVRRKTDESSIASTLPELTTSASSDTDDFEMVKPFGSPKKKALRDAKAFQVTASSTLFEGHATTNKAFQSMTVDELLSRLPSLKVDVIQGIWLEAMRQEYSRLKVLLDDAGNVKLDTHHDLRHFGEVHSRRTGHIYCH